MSRCPARHPDTGLQCADDADPHPGDHYATEGGGAVWSNPDRVDPARARQRLAEQGQAAVGLAREGAAVMRKMARTSDSDATHKAAETYVLSGARNRVIDRVARLLEARQGDWVDATEFDRLAKSGERRMRELRDDYGWPIEIRDKPGAINAYQHRLLDGFVIPTA
jgi:hypothetical protein